MKPFYLVIAIMTIISSVVAIKLYNPFETKNDDLKEISSSEIKEKELEMLKLSQQALGKILEAERTRTLEAGVDYYSPAEEKLDRAFSVYKKLESIQNLQILPNPSTIIVKL